MDHTATVPTDTLAYLARLHAANTKMMLTLEMIAGRIGADAVSIMAARQAIKDVALIMATNNGNPSNVDPHPTLDLDLDLDLSDDPEGDQGREYQP